MASLTARISNNLIGNSSCYGSSIVHIGDTCVVCGISLLCGIPSVDEPDCGDMVFDFTVVDPRQLDNDRQNKSDYAYQVESILNSIFIRGNIVDFTSLCIEKGQSAFRLVVNLTCLSEANNVIDACVMATASALNNVLLPAHEIVSGSLVLLEERKNSLTILKQPRCFTMALGDNSQSGSLICVIDSNSNIIYSQFLTSGDAPLLPCNLDGMLSKCIEYININQPIN